MSKSSLLKGNYKLLYVTGERASGGVIFTKTQDGQWMLTEGAPYLMRVIGRTPVKDVGKLLTEKGFKWEWI